MTYPKVLLDEDALLRVLCAWLGALEGALPLDVEEESRRFEESPVAAGWWPNWLSEAPATEMLRVYPRRALDRPGLKRSEAHFTLDRQTSEALQKLCRELVMTPRDAFLALWALVVARLTASDQVTLLATCSLPGAQKSGLGTD